MSDSRRLLRIVLLAGPLLLLTDCDTIDLASLDLPAITLPWDTDAPKAALQQDVADAMPAPDGMQRDDTPFGASAP